MDTHPSDIPVAKIYDIKDEVQATQAAQEMVKAGFADRQDGFRVIMPKEKKLAKRIGYTIITTINYELRRMEQRREVRYWTYHHDEEHYAIVLIDNRVLENLGL
jgi:hypothetical protein